MPGLRAPSDYSEEPPRHHSLKVNSKEPFNAEPHRSALLSFITPVDFFYKRNHGPIPVVDDIERYSVSIGGLVEYPIELPLSEIRKLPKYNVAATLQCAGNRRTAMSKTRTVKGVGWDVAAIGNAIWGGAKLADVFELIGIPKLTSSTPLGGKHVEFISIDNCKEENGGPYKASIPLRQATNPEADVLLAYEMNGENSQDIVDVINKSAQTVQAAEAGIRQIDALARRQKVSMIQKRANLLDISLKLIVTKAATKTSSLARQRELS